MSRRGRDERGGGGAKLRRPNGEGGCQVEEEEGKGWILG